MSEQGRRLLTLYRDILRAHRAHLRPGLRRLGDDYVKSEFRLHRQAKPEFLTSFEEQWSNYLATVQQDTKDGVPVPVHVEEVEPHLNDEQKKQLSKLSEHIHSIR
mmetsp:Transcript_796/g.1714  ORF Transcript_796/g.1714 Transcript_796/m.1714 type:complete len:105 (+) Transcript_796:3-317(+)